MLGDLFVIGVSWRTAPVDVRERLAFADDEREQTLRALLDTTSIHEALVVSTCNRVEIYGATAPGTPRSEVATASAEALHFLARTHQLDRETLAGAVYEHIEERAIEHAFRVASSLDSMVVGESQILGQLKDAYGAAVKVGAAGPLLGRCMERAFSVAKRVRTETGISRGSANVSSVAVDLARHVFGDLAGTTILLVGAGKMSALAARHLRSDGAGGLLVTNRSAERAAELAEAVNGVARPWDQLPSLLALADVVITSTGSREPVLTRSLFKKVVKARRYRPIVVIDIAVPRDAEPAITKYDGVYLFDIDDLQRVVSENLKARAKEAEAAQRIVSAEAGRFATWLRSQAVVPTIRDLRAHFATVARAEADRVIRRLGDDASILDRDAAIRQLANGIVNKLLHSPLTALKQGSDDAEALVDATRRLFALSEPEDGDTARGDAEGDAGGDDRRATAAVEVTKRAAHE